MGGNRLVGRFPTLVVGGPDDAGQGSWIPTASTVQVGDELARCFAADTVTRDQVFPRLRYFNADLGLMG